MCSDEKGGRGAEWEGGRGGGGGLRRPLTSTAAPRRTRATATAATPPTRHAHRVSARRSTGRPPTHGCL